MQFAAKKGVFSTSGVPWPPALLIVVATGIGIAATSHPTKQQPRLQFITDGRSMDSAEGASQAPGSPKPIMAMHANISLKPPTKLPGADMAASLAEQQQRIVFGSTPIAGGRAKPFATITGRGGEDRAVSSPAMPAPTNLAPPRSKPAYRDASPELHAAMAHAANATALPRDVVSIRISEVTPTPAAPAQPLSEVQRLRPALPAPKFGAALMAPQTPAQDGLRNLATPTASPPSPANAALAPSAVSADALKWIVSSTPQDDARMFGVSSASLAATASSQVATELAPVADAAPLESAPQPAAEERASSSVEPISAQPAQDAPSPPSAAERTTAKLSPALLPAQTDRPTGASEPRPMASADPVGESSSAALARVHAANTPSVNDLAFAVPVLVKGAQAGNVVVRVLGDASVHSDTVHANFWLCLADVLDAIRPKMDAELYARLRSSKSADTLVTLETLRSLGISAAFTRAGDLQLG